MNKKGFTLIELLVVIAIIGILSSVVLASLNSARGKGNDAKVKGQLSSLRGAIEIYANGNNNNYTACGGSGACDGLMFTNTTSGVSALITNGNYPNGTTVVCNSSASAWAVEANLSTSGQYWCVDSTGISKQVTTA